MKLHEPDKFSESNCLAVITEMLVIIFLALILGGFIGWALMQPGASW